MHELLVDVLGESVALSFGEHVAFFEECPERLEVHLERRHVHIALE